MRRLERLSLPLLLFLSASALGATVTITPSATTVGKGTPVTFTVAVTPSTDVRQIQVQYQDETGQDTATAAPATFTHTFSSAAFNVGVTATVSYLNNDRDDVATATVNVVGLSLTGPGSPIRGAFGVYSAQAAPAGAQASQFSWSYEWSGGSNTYTDMTATSVSCWTGKMVVGGTLRCSALVAGVRSESMLVVDPSQRDWTVPIFCDQDNETWGDELYADVDLGKNRDRDSNDPNAVFVPRNGSSFRPAWTMASVTTGPCAGWYYVSNSTLRVQRETVINQYLKGGTLGDSSFADANVTCLSPGPAEFLLAVKHHEYRGTPEVEMSPYGHQGRLERWVRQANGDAKQHIEGLADRSSTSLIVRVDQTISSDESAVRNYCLDETQMQGEMPNWGWGSSTALGFGLTRRWNGIDWTYFCNNGPNGF